MSKTKKNPEIGENFCKLNIQLRTFIYIFFKKALKIQLVLINGKSLIDDLY